MEISEILPNPIHSNVSRIKKNDIISSEFDQNYLLNNSYDFSHKNTTNDNKLDKTMNKNGILDYTQRHNWMPKSEEDFYNGGAYPEVHVAQYPPGFKQDTSNSSNALVKHFDNQGNVKYDNLLLANSISGSKVIHSLPQNMTKGHTNLDLITQETEENIIDTATETSLALEKLLNTKISTTLKTLNNPPKSEEKSEYIRYTPAFGLPELKSGSRQRLIKMVEAQVDPMMPSCYNINKKVPRGPPSPPAPILHSPPRKLTSKEAQDWKIPPCISNWKNPRGYTIPLHMRVAADGKNLENISINENFAKMSESLYLAESNARKAVEYRAGIEKKKKQKEKERQEAKLRRLAEEARKEMSGLQFVSSSNQDIDSLQIPKDASLKTKNSISSDSNVLNDSLNDKIKNYENVEQEIALRNEIRHERSRARQRDRNIQNAAPEKRSKLERERERNISEKIAIGLPITSSNVSSTMYDERLFNQSKGIDAGFNDEEEFNVYDKPWSKDKNIGRAIYHPSKDLDEEVYGPNLDKMANEKRFIPDKHFQGIKSNKTQRESLSDTTKRGPVEFQEDPFGLDEFFQEVKQGKKK